ISDLTSRLEEDWPTLACPSGDGLKFWEHEWDKHGTCSENALDQHSYFQKALDLKYKANLLQALNTAGIRPDGRNYSLGSIKEAIKEGVGFTPYVECNVDASGNHQLYQVHLCVDSSGSDFIECPVLPHGRRCGSEIEFPTFSDPSDGLACVDLLAFLSLLLEWGVVLFYLAGFGWGGGLGLGVLRRFLGGRLGVGILFHSCCYRLSNIDFKLDAVEDG
ncbi:Ribonuclease pancreatic beta-type, partial [Sarracenia purpurea var. burkii]